MKTLSRLGAVACALMSFAASACAADADAKSRELVAISHVSTLPQGSLAISDDGSYTFLDSSTETETPGKLSASELDAVKTHVARPALENLYLHRSADDDACGQADDGYILSSRLGGACFVVSTVSEPTAQADLNFFTTLYQAKSGSK